MTIQQSSRSALSESITALIAFAKAATQPPSLSHTASDVIPTAYVARNKSIIGHPALTKVTFVERPAMHFAAQKVHRSGLYGTVRTCICVYMAGCMYLSASLSLLSPP